MTSPGRSDDGDASPKANRMERFDDNSIIRMPSSFDFGDEGMTGQKPEPQGLNKIFQRCKEEPLVPIGCVLTCGALFGSAVGLRKGNKDMAQRMFRYRIGFQFATLGFVIAGALYYGNDRASRKQEDQAVQQQKAMDRRAAWLRELDSRDRLLKERSRRLAEKKEQPHQ